MNTLKYILIKIEFLAYAFMFILGIGAAESEQWFSAILLMFGPFALCKIFNIERQVKFLEVYDRAWNYKTTKTIQNRKFLA